MNRTEWNYGVDVVIGGALVLSAVSGLVFLLPVGETAAALGVGYRVWDALHLWSSLAMMAGVAVHLVLHARWIATMTGRAVRRSPESRREHAGHTMTDEVIA